MGVSRATAGCLEQWTIGMKENREQKDTVEDLVYYILAVYRRMGQCSHEEEGSFNGSQGGNGQQMEENKVS